MVGLPSVLVPELLAVQVRRAAAGRGRGGAGAARGETATEIRTTVQWTVHCSSYLDTEEARDLKEKVERRGLARPDTLHPEWILHSTVESKAGRLGYLVRWAVSASLLLAAKSQRLQGRRGGPARWTELQRTRPGTATLPLLSLQITTILSTDFWQGETVHN